MYENCTDVFKIIKSVKDYLSQKTFIPVILVFKLREIVEVYKNIKDYLILIFNLKTWLKEGITEMKVWA